jgi:hypothetical protein
MIKGRKPILKRAGFGQVTFHTMKPFMNTLEAGKIKKSPACLSNPTLHTLRRFSVIIVFGQDFGAWLSSSALIGLNMMSSFALQGVAR